MKKTVAIILCVFTLLLSLPLNCFAAETAVEPELLCDVQTTVPKMYINVDAGYSIDTIHANKDAKIRAHVRVTGAENSAHNMASTGIEIKTRGNSTFLYPKKPYQIKFDSKTDMFGMGAEKKWILLANYVDGSFIRNKIVFDMAEAMGMAYTCKSYFVDLYINGNYVGLYQLCEKVEIGDNRVPLEHDMGVIAEMESAKRVAEEEFYFTTKTTGKPFVYKEYNTDFEEASAEEVSAVRAFFEERINTLESELYQNGENWELVESLIDVDSFIMFYFINEFCMNVDATLASTFFYIDGPDDVLHMGPLWDYDRCFGTYNDGSYEQGSEADFLKNIIDSSDEYRVEWFKMLFQYPQFVERANELYTEKISAAFDPQRINATIDAYQSVLYESLMKNYVDEGWAIFHSISDAEFFSNRTDATEYLTFTTNSIKTNIANRKAYLDKAYGEHHPVLLYQHNNGRVYSGGSMTDSEGMNGFSASLQSHIDGGISYSATGTSLIVSSGANGERVRGTKLSTLSIKLEGNVANYYTVQYRALYNGNWSTWRSDGTSVGVRNTTIERIQVRLVEKTPVLYGTVEFAGADLAPVSAIAGNLITLPALPEGVEGWYTDSTFTGEPVTELTVAEGTTVIYAKVPALDPGDLNGDGKVNAQDANVLKRIISGSAKATEEQLRAADLNGDGIVNSIDSNLMSRYNAGLVASFE